MNHKHTAKLIKESCFIFCAAPDNCNPRAHGGVSHFILCATCGATKLENVNQNYIERGKWTAAQRED